MLLVVFDVDGTLVDSQAQIVAAMAAAFGAEGLDLPPRQTLLSIVGLSLPVAMAHLVPGSDAGRIGRLVEGYKASFSANRQAGGPSGTPPLYPGALEAVTALAQHPDVLLGIATGKSRRGLEHLLEAHDLRSHFVTLQPADLHPSKPHPAMLRAALDEAGVAPGAAVMIGDTSFDMAMARAAGVAGLGVTWGYHASQVLVDEGAETVLDGFEGLIPYLQASGRMA